MQVDLTNQKQHILQSEITLKLILLAGGAGVFWGRCIANISPTASSSAVLILSVDASLN